LYHSPLAVDDFAMCGHDPDEVQGCTRNGDVGMVSLWQKNRVAIAYHLYLCGADSIGVDQLESEGRRGHVDEHVYLLEHRGVFVRRPTCPIAGQGSRDAYYQLARLNITSEQDIDLSMRTCCSCDEVQLLILSHGISGDKLQWIVALDGSETLDQICLGLGLNPDRKSLRHV
jgi:hypothetical protein